MLNRFSVQALIRRSLYWKLPKRWPRSIFATKTLAVFIIYIVFGIAYRWKCISIDIIAIFDIVNADAVPMAIHMRSRWVGADRRRSGRLHLGVVGRPWRYATLGGTSRWLVTILRLKCWRLLLLLLLLRAEATLRLLIWIWKLKRGWFLCSCNLFTTAGHL